MRAHAHMQACARAAISDRGKQSDARSKRAVCGILQMISCCCNSGTHACTLVHTLTHARAHAHARTHACTHACTDARMHARTHACTHMHACTNAHMHARIHACTCTRARTHACTHACMHTCTHAHTHAHAHSHMHACGSVSQSLCGCGTFWYVCVLEVVPLCISHAHALGQLLCAPPLKWPLPPSHPGWIGEPMASLGYRSANIFLTTFWRTPTANAEGWIDSEGSVGKVSAISVFRYLQVSTGPRRSPTACSRMLKKNRMASLGYWSALCPFYIGIC